MTAGERRALAQLDLVLSREDPALAELFAGFQARTPAPRRRRVPPLAHPTTRLRGHLLVVAAGLLGAVAVAGMVVGLTLPVAALTVGGIALCLVAGALAVLGLTLPPQLRDAGSPLARTVPD